MSAVSGVVRHARRFALGAPALVASVFLCAPGAAAPAGDRSPGPPLRLDRVETALVERVQWPVRLQPLVPGGCDDLDLGVVKVREDGAARRVTGLDQRRLPTIHALLIDTSGSMEALFGGALGAARSYVRAVPAGDRTLIAGFDENLRLYAGPTADGEQAVQALAGMRAAEDRFTALWDAVYHVVGYLAGLEARKVVVLVSDGCDSTSLPIHTFETVMARIERTPGLTVLPVIIGSGATCSTRVGRFVPTPEGGIPMPPASAMEALGRRSGGELFRVRTGDDLAAAFADMVQRLQEEGTLVWAGVPFAEGARDDARRQDVRRRKLRIEGRLKGRCQVGNAGPPTRLVSRDEPSGRPRSPVLKARGGRLTGTVTDLAVERGHLYDAGRSRQLGRPVGSPDRSPEIDERSIDIALPDVAVESAIPLDPARLILESMQRSASPPPAGQSRGEPFLQGQAFFYLREPLAWALLGTPRTGAWARRRIHQDRERFAEELLSEARERGPVSAETARQVREAILGRAVRTVEVTRYLGAWLGDLHAPTVARELERRALVDPSDISPAALRQAWPALVRTFGPPTRRRVLAWLHPAYDPRQDAVGYWRLHLPRPEEGRLPDDMIPSRPVGLQVVAWARSNRGLPAFDGEIAVVSIDYEPAGTSAGRRFNEWLYQEGRSQRLGRAAPLWKATLRVVAPAGGEAGLESAVLDVLFPVDAAAYAELVDRDPPAAGLDDESEAAAAARDADPGRLDENNEDLADFCIDVLPAAGAPSASPLADRLRQELRARERDCPA